MRNRMVLLIMILFTININQVKSQDFEIPKDYILVAKEDYAKYEKDIIACANWMENSPLDKYEAKRIDVNTFFMKWLTGSPSVSISLNTDLIVKYTEKNPDLLMIFIAGWTRFSLENNYSKDQQKGYFEGYKSIINVYKKGLGIKRDKNIEQLIKIYDKGELKNWIKENLIL
ncbi:hypothetical protein [Plebeiibacterium sediminum]|uniref:Uncharacterized protein n=1 Tax=Plebeiibacterium sediminum TaxID=2992112 RepID=A0AAE3SHL6_9BACT|nr:hypothetical protein [Plebeiobacterium sediminum]MCW3789660.1 hypothetical protein [Plebeiobacterium sediminum]